VSKFKLTRTFFFTLFLIFFIFIDGIYLIVTHPARRIFLFLALSLFFILFLGIWYYKQHTLIPDFIENRFFPISLLMLGVIFSLFFPAGRVPDERYHFQMSYAYANLISFNKNPNEIRSEDLVIDKDLLADGNIDSSTWKNEQDYFSIFATKTSTDEFPKKITASDWSSNPPQLKLISALGINLARLLNLSGILLFYIGRIFNLFFGATLIIIAVRITPIGKNIMMSVALLPMTLHLLGSYSYDAGIIGLSFILIALLLRAIYAPNKINIKEISLITLFSILLAPCKIVYMFISCLFFLIPSSRFNKKHLAFFYKILLFLIVISSIIFFRLPTLQTISSSTQVDVRGLETGTFYSISDVLLHPGKTIMMYLRTFHALGDFYLYSMVGGSLGWLQDNLRAPYYLDGTLFLCLFIAAQRSNDDPYVPSKKSRMVFGLITVASVLAIMLSMLIGWTFNTEIVINGVQGRYFLPVLPLGLLAMRNHTIQIHANMGYALITGMTALNMSYLTLLTMLILST
jgi:uncharacterized membrane protein